MSLSGRSVSTQSATPEANLEGLRRALGDTPADVSHHRRALAAVATQSMEFREHFVEYGQTYASAAILDDGTPAASPLDDVRLYVPGTRPGAPLPHAELEDQDGNRLSMMSLVRPGPFLLIAGEDGGAWCDAAKELAETLGFPVRGVRIGTLEGDYRDPRCTWLKHKAIGRRGAILVRPDRYVGWRSLEGSEDPLRDLRAALEGVLCRAAA